ncbi:MAG: hypothetical protein SGI99_03645 [Pseudomonadota bacterium]|nr:hypothetical protein [Pseudomonadota bacterium]
MFAKIDWALVLVLAFTPVAAKTEQRYVDIEQRLTAEQRRATGVDTLSREQLALLNRLLREETTTPAQVESQPSEPQPGRPTFVSSDNKPIKSRLHGSVNGWEPGSVFTLQNGQKWKVLKGSVKLPNALQAPEIILVPGIAGRWFLQVSEEMPKARVERIE